MVSSIDLRPTLLDIAGVDAAVSTMDSRSFWNVAQDDDDDDEGRDPVKVCNQG